MQNYTFLLFEIKLKYFCKLKQTDKIIMKKYNNLVEWILKILNSWKSTCIILFKILIPVSIIIKILQETGWIYYVGIAFEPFMQMMGLPGEMGIVWASAILGNIYGALLAFYSLEPLYPLTVAQITVLMTVILVAHTFLIEIVVAYKAGVKLIPIILIRFGCALLIGILLHQIYQTVGWLQMPASQIVQLSNVTEPGWISWIINELKNYASISIIILILLVVIEILKRTGLIEVLNRFLEPSLRAIGMNSTIVPVTIIGLTLGLAYGGALIIEETKKQEFSKKDIFYSLLLMSLFHSIIEDSLLMFSVGANWSGIILFRSIFTFIIIAITIRITRNWTNEKMNKYLTRNNIK